MLWLELGTRLAIEVLACWTLAVHACMALGAPAWAAWPFALAGAGLLQRLQRADWQRARTIAAGERRFALATLAIAAAFSIPALLLLTTTADDFNFFHRAAWQASHLGSPFAWGDTAFNLPGLAAISPLHQLTTWELGIAMNAALVGIDPLAAYHNGAVALGQLLLAALFALWLREIGFGPRAALAGTVAVLAFFYLDDPLIRSWGIGYRMLWVGKMLQWLWLLPAALWLALRYLRDPCARTLLHPALCGVAAVGLSGSGVFLLPGVFAAASLAGLVLHPLGGRRLVACGALNLGSLYCFGVAALLLGGVLEQPRDMSAWTAGFPADWSSNLMLVMGNAAGVARHVWLAAAVPALCLAPADRRFFVAYAFALVALFANPLAGPLWLDTVQPGSFWRVMLLFAVPLGAASAAAACVERLQLRSATALGIALALIGALRWLPIPTERIIPHRFAAKSPLELRLPPHELRFVREVAHELEGRSLLAAPGVAITAALRVPSLRLEAARLKDTKHVFANAGNPREGERRATAWAWMASCEPSSEGARAVRASIARDHPVDALIFHDCGRDGAIEAERSRVRAVPGARWSEVARSNGYVLYLRR